MGKGSAPVSPAESTTAEARRLASIQGDIAQGVFVDSTPFRTQTFGRLTDEVRGLDDPITLASLEGNPAFPAIKDATESQFARARENILSTLPSGNVLEDSLARVEDQRARTLSSSLSALAADELGRRERMFDRAANLSIGAPSAALGGLSGASSNLTALAGQQAQVAQAQAQQAAGKDRAIGQAAGTAAAIAFK